MLKIEGQAEASLRGIVEFRAMHGTAPTSIEGPRYARTFNKTGSRRRQLIFQIAGELA